VKHNSESERRSPSSEEEREERESRAEIQNAEDYNEIFQPKNSISEAALLPQPSAPDCEAEARGLLRNSVTVALCPLAPTWAPHPQGLAGLDFMGPKAGTRSSQVEEQRGYRSKWAERGRAESSWGQRRVLYA
jgi:hypothetical protein